MFEIGPEFLISVQTGYFSGFPEPCPRGMASLDPRGLIGRIYVGDHQKLLHTKYISSGSHGFRDYKSIVHDPLGCGQFGPYVLDWQDLCKGPLNIATYRPVVIVISNRDYM